MQLRIDLLIPQLPEVLCGCTGEDLMTDPAALAKMAYPDGTIYAYCLGCNETVESPDYGCKGIWLIFGAD